MKLTEPQLNSTVDIGRTPCYTQNYCRTADLFSIVHWNPGQHWLTALAPGPVGGEVGYPQEVSIARVSPR